LTSTIFGLLLTEGFTDNQSFSDDTEMSCLSLQAYYRLHLLSNCKSNREGEWPESRCTI